MLIDGPKEVTISNGDGTARAEADPKFGSVLGKSLENFNYRNWCY